MFQWISDNSDVVSAIANVRCGDFNTRRGVTDIRVIDDEELQQDPRRHTFQGPLGPGEYTSIGTFASLIDRMGVDQNELADRIERTAQPLSIEVMVVADYSSDNLLIGARRQFSAECCDRQWVLSSHTTETEQIVSRRERKRIRGWIASEAARYDHAE